MIVIKSHNPVTIADVHVASSHADVHNYGEPEWAYIDRAVTTAHVG